MTLNKIPVAGTREVWLEHLVLSFEQSQPHRSSLVLAHILWLITPLVAMVSIKSTGPKHHFSLLLPCLVALGKKNQPNIHCILVFTKLLENQVSIVKCLFFINTGTFLYFSDTMILMPRGSRIQLVSPVMPATSVSGSCFNFWYTNYGDAFSKLTVYLQLQVGIKLKNPEFSVKG